MWDRRLPMRSKIHRFVLALSCAVGTVGVVTYGQGVEEFKKIAGPEFELEDNFGCPAEFPAAVAFLGHKADLNGDGIVCTNKEGITYVDNDAAEPGGGAGHV